MISEQANQNLTFTLPVVDKLVSWLSFYKIFQKSIYASAACNISLAFYSIPEVILRPTNLTVYLPANSNLNKSKKTYVPLEVVLGVFEIYIKKLDRNTNFYPFVNFCNQ